MRGDARWSAACGALVAPERPGARRCRALESFAVSIGEPAAPLGPEIDIVATSDAGPAAMRGGIMRTAALAGGMLLALASSPLLIRHLGDADFGRYATVLAVVTIVSGLVDGGITTIALRELSTTMDATARDRLMSDLLGLRLVLGFAGIVGAVAFSALAGYGSTLVLGTLLAGVGFVITSTQTLVAAVLQSRLRFGWAALIELSRQFVNAALIIALVLAGAGVLSFLAVAIPAGLTGLVLTVVLVRGIVVLRPAFHPRHWYPLLRETIVFAIAIAVNAVYFRVTLVIMSIVSTATQTGYFAVSYRIIEVLIAVPALLIGAAFPIISRAAHADRERFSYAAGRMFELALFFGGLMTICVMLAAPFAIEILAGSSEHPSVGVLQIQSVAMLASFVAAGTGYPLLSMHRNRETLLANCVSLAVAVALAFALVPAHGAHGAAVAAIVADLSLAIGNTTMLVRRGGPRLPFSAVPITLVAGVAGYGAGRLVGIHPLVEVAAGATVFLLTLVAMRRFPPEVRDVLRRRTVTRS
jgi:O-antigen/teichoic acid export membrane protein